MKIIAVIGMIFCGAICGHQEESFVITGRHGHELHGVVVSPEDPHATIIWLHGLGGHCWRALSVKKYMADRGIMSIGFDMRGHGKSSGGRGVAHDMEEWIADLEDVYFYCKSVIRGPVFLVGHSAGAAIALRYVQHERAIPLGASLALAPTLRFHSSRLSGFKKTIAQWAGMVMPWVQVPQTRSDKVSLLFTRDIAAIKEDQDDQYLLKHINLGTLSVCLYEFDTVYQGISGTCVPVHILAAGQEYIAQSEAIERHFNQLPDNHKHTMVVFPGVRHTMLRDIGKEAVFDEIVRIVNSYCLASAHE